LVKGRTDDLRNDERCEVRVSFLATVAKFACEGVMESLGTLYSLMFTIFFTKVGVKFVKVVI
jgi:hypothetical protein